RVVRARHLLDVVAQFQRGPGALPQGEGWVVLASRAPAGAARYPDLADVRGQAGARRALEIAAAGGHSLLLVGPPGAGKSLAASRVPSILPPPGGAEAPQGARVRGR